MKNKSWIRSPWTISIVTAVFSFLLTLIYDYSKSKPIFSTIMQILKRLWYFIILILNFNVKVWWLIMGVIVIIAIIYFTVKLKQEEIVKPDFCNYRNDKFKFWRWSWDWEFDYFENTWHVTNLTAHCPNCDTPLIDCSMGYGASFECPRCDFKSTDSQCDVPFKVERIILDNVQRKKEK